MYSDEHKKYLRKIRVHKFFIKFLQLMIIVLFIIIWQLLADAGIIDTFIFSSPKLVLDTFINLYNSNNLFMHIWITVFEVFISFSLATIIGLIIASILWWNKNIAKVIDPYLTVLNSLPKVALGPIIIIWFGSGIKSIIVMALLISLIITIINIYQGFINIDNNKIKLMKSFKASKTKIFLKLVIPGSMKVIMNTIKINISMSLIGVIMGEFLVSKKGIGYLIVYGSQVFNLNLVITGIILLCVVASVMYYLISFLENKIIK